MTLAVTPASNWKRQTEVRLLPSGNAVELRRPSVVDTIMTDGALPEGMAAVIMEGFFTRNNAEWKPKPEDMPALAALMAKLCRASFVNPRIVDDGIEPDYNANEIALADVSDVDRRAVLNWVLGGGEAQAVTPFPQKQMAGVASVPNGKTVRAKTR